MCLSSYHIKFRDEKLLSCACFCNHERKCYLQFAHKPAFMQVNLLVLLRLMLIQPQDEPI
jgi:hypothetical protein